MTEVGADTGKRERMSHDTVGGPTVVNLEAQQRGCDDPIATRTRLSNQMIRNRVIQNQNESY